MSIPLIAGIAVLVLIVAIALSQRARGPRVTQIERKVEHRGDEENTPEDCNS
jgi:hypothetical protein